MDIKDKIIFGLLAVLIVVAGYFQYVTDVMQSRMSVLNEQDSRHINIVDKEFREDLRKLNLNEHTRISDRRFKDIEQDHRDLQDSFDSFRRKTQRKLADLEQSATSYDKRLKEIEDLPLIQKEKAKSKKE